MEDDYLPLYEVVDHDKNKEPSNVTKSSGYEKLIVKDHANSVQKEYQLPQSDTSYVHYSAYSEIATEIQTLKRNSRHLKMLFSIGGIVMFVLLIIVVCIFTATWIRFSRNLAHVQKSLIEEVDNVQGDSNTKHTEHDQRNLTEQINHVQRTLMEQIDHVHESVTKRVDILSEAFHNLHSHGSFQNCSQETTTCNFIHNSAGSGSWLYCDTPNLQMQKRVS